MVGTDKPDFSASSLWSTPASDLAARICAAVIIALGFPQRFR
jgi:hypothetical protein